MVQGLALVVAQVRHTSALRVAAGFNNSTPTAVRPNPSVNLTRYGTQRKPGPRALRHHREPGLRCAPPRAGYLER